MSTSLTVNGKTFSYPSAGEDPGWGEDATDWATEVTSVLNNLQGTGDINESNFTVPAAAQTDQSVTGLLFDGAITRSAIIDYSIYRRNDTDTSGYTQSGELIVHYDTDASAANKWVISHRQFGDSLVSFDISSSGQILYTSTALPAGDTESGYIGTMKFRARTFNVS